MWWFLAAAAIIISGVIFAYYQTTAVKTTHIDIKSERLPHEFDGMKIVQLSDLQNSKYPHFYDKIAAQTATQHPDIIVFTGDIIDRRKYNIGNAEEFLKKLSGIAPIYFVSGNHEAWCGKYDEVRRLLQKYNVQILDDKSVDIIKNGEKITLYGVNDPGFITNDKIGADCSEFVCRLNRLHNDDGSYGILLTHRPEYIDAYSDFGYDLVFSGHAHGGQFRLPFIGALYAPHQGIFPKLTSGVHKRGGTTQIISRGLGSGKLQFRTFNRPEIIAVTLKSDSAK